MLVRANHLKRWDAKPLALNRGEWKGSRAAGRESVVARRYDAAMGSTSVGFISVGFGRISTEVLQ